MKRKENEDLTFLRQKARESAPQTPESLSPENIEALVTGKKQKKHRRPVRAIVSVAVAACVVLTSVVVLRETVIAPSRVKRTVKNAGTPVSCSEVARRIESHRREEKIKGFSFNYGAKYASDSMIAEEAEGAVAAMPAENAAVTAGQERVGDDAYSEYAETNVRTEGVLEADCIKTDGKYLYALAGEQVLIVDPAGEMRLVGSVDLSENLDLWSDEFYLLGDRLLIVGEDYNDKNGESAVVLLYDISDPASPVRERALRWAGSCVSSRVTNDRLLLVTVYYPDTDGFKRNDSTTFLPCYTAEDGAPVYAAEEDLYLGGDDGDTVFTTVTLLDLSSNDAEPQSATLFGDAGDLYCAAETLYLYSAVYPAETYFFNTDSFTATTCIQKLDITGEKPVITATGSVPGTVLNTFALDEYGGFLRVAAGDGDGNRVYVLDGELKQTGVSEVLAKGEYIRSVRFMGNYAYVVTFMQTDPLFVLDLSDPAAPALKGEVKLPGFSAYLHPAGEGYLIGVGYGGTEDGLDGSAKISVFDVRDPANPKETGSLTLRDANLNTYYKAFVTLPDGSFLLPFTKNEQVKNERPMESDPEIAVAPAEPETAAPAEPETAAPVEPETAASVEPETAASVEETAVAPAEEPQTAAVSDEPATVAADAYWDGDYWEEYVWSVVPGALVVSVENGVPAARYTLLGAATENDWPEVRATFIGSSAYVLSTTYDLLRVERFSLTDGTADGACDFTLTHSYADGDDDVVVYENPAIFD